MARLRFPGRPGYRFGRLGVQYGANEPKKECDAGTQLIANIHRGLRYFRELFGESDEEEFDGFSEREITKVAKKLSTITAALAATYKQNAPSQSPSKQLVSGPRPIRQSASWSRVKVRQSYNTMLKDSLVRQTKTRISPKGKVSASKTGDNKRGRKAHVKLKTIKIRLGTGGKRGQIVHGRGSLPREWTSSDDDSDLEPLASKVWAPKGRSKTWSEAEHIKSKRSAKIAGLVRLPERSLAKQLLVKAKASQKKLQAAKTPGLCHRKQFVLPTVSSRSSRKIIPNKRFLEDSYGEMTSSSTVKKVKTEAEMSVTAVLSETVTADVSMPLANTTPVIDPKVSLFDQPLIVEGKRQRKPSMRLIRQLSDDTVVDHKRKQSEERRKGSGHLVLPSSGSVDSLEDLDRSVAATKRHGQSILRKAKLRLNQAAMNRSKAALVRSLKRKMRREQEAGVSTSTQQQFLPLDMKPLSVQISPIKFGVLSPETPVFGAAGLSAVSPFGRDSTDLSPFSSRTEGAAAESHEKKQKKKSSLGGGNACVVCGRSRLPSYLYYGVVACQPCSRFYRRRSTDIIHGGATFTCDKRGICDVTHIDGKLDHCVACRYKKCRRFFPAPERMRDMLKLKHIYRRKKWLKKRKPHTPDVAKPAASSEEKPAAAAMERTPEDVISVGMATASSPPFTQVKDLTKSNPDTSIFNLSSVFGDAESQQQLDASHSSDIAGDIPESPESVASMTEDGMPCHQPRIKHVCRRACVALGAPATFPLQGELRLSALPNIEKERLLNMPSSPDSDDMSMDEIIRQARDDKDVVVTIKRTPNKAFSALVPRALHKGSGSRGEEPCRPAVHKTPTWRKSGAGRKRKIRCKMCRGCLSTECGKCASCLDMPKFGGRGVMKKACVERTCINPDYATIGSVATTTSTNPFMGRVSHMSHRSGVEDGSNDSSSYPPKGASPDEKKSHSTENGGRYRVTKMKTGGHGTAGRLVTRPPPSRGSHKRTMPLLSVPRQAKWSVQCNSNHRLNMDFMEDYDIDVAWQRGIALVSSTPLCLRNVCLLCGSAGEELVYCRVCCEPFHPFCLEEEERPRTDHLDNWCCRRCLFCRVCGQQSNLLQCDRCQETYHPECLGPNYPTKPSSNKHIWVCTKCVKCKSCGATSPGDDRNAVWTHDFSLCYMCGQLMDKGNFCPVCQKCYSDDDWDSKMIQCSSCECWVHARCEGLTDEMYEIVSFMSEGMTFYCHVCQPTRPVGWQKAINRLRDCRLSTVLDVLFGCKKGQLLQSIPTSSVSSERTEKEIKDETINTSDTDLISLNITAMDTGSADVAKESCTVATDTGPDDVAKESCTVTVGTVPVDVAKEPSSVAMGTVSVDIAKVPSAVAMGTVPVDVAKEPCTVAMGIVPVDVAKDPVARTEVPCAIMPSVARETGAVMLDSACSLGLGELGGSCPITLGSGWEGALDSDTECGKVLHKEGLGEGSRGEGVMMNGPEGEGCEEDVEVCRRKGLKDFIMSQVENLGTSDTTGVNVGVLCHDVDSCHQIGTDGDRTVIDAGGKCHTGCAPGVTLCGVDTSDRQCDMSDCVTERQTSCDGAPTLASTTSCCLGGSMSSSGCDSVDVTQKSDMSSVCRRDPDVGSAHCCLKTSSADTQVSPATEPTQGCREACTGTIDCVKDETCMETGDSTTALSSSLEVNVGRSPPSICSLEHVMSPSSSSTLTAPNMSPVLETDSQEELDCPRLGGSAQLTHTEHAPPMTKAVEKVPPPHDLNGVREKLTKNGYSSVEEFSDDIVRIIQDNVSQQVAAQWKKSNSSFRNLFVKQMEKYFPWFCVASSRHWFENKNCPDGVLPQAVLPPTSDHTYAQWLVRVKEREAPSQLSPFKKVATPQKLHRIPMGYLDGDSAAENTLQGATGLEQIADDPRRCLFCGMFGDRKPSDAGRQMYASQDDWVHVNCALWSAEVFEEVDGTLQHVHIAAKRGKHMKCDHCGKLGATVGCCQKGCPANYHFMCARHTQCVFQEDKKVYCRYHRYSVHHKLVSEDNFEVQRRACVELDLGKFMKKSWQKGLSPDSISVLAGSMTVESLGHLTPLSDCRTTLFPVGYCVTRVYWSTIDARRRCIYTCRIIEVKPVHQVAAPVVDEDMTIVHDRAHPKYSTEAEEAFNARMKASMAASEKDGHDEAEVSFCETNNTDESMAGVLPWRSGAWTRYVSEEPGGVQGVGDDGSPLFHPNSSLTLTGQVSVKQEASVGLELTKRHAPGVDLSKLSANTLKLLGQAANTLSRSSVPVNVYPNDELQLTTIVDRLNQAAAKNKRSHTSHENSVDGSLSSSQSSSNSREGSVERSSVVRPIATDRVSLQPSLERVAETDVAFSRQRTLLKQPLNTDTLSRPPQQSKSTCVIGAVGGVKASPLLRPKTLTNDGHRPVLATDTGHRDSGQGGDLTSVVRVTNILGQSCPSMDTRRVNGGSMSTSTTHRKTQGVGNSLDVSDVVDSTNNDGGATGHKSGAKVVHTISQVSGAKAVHTVSTVSGATSPPAGKKCYRVVPVGNITQSNDAKNVLNIVTKTASMTPSVTCQENKTCQASPVMQPRPAPGVLNIVNQTASSESMAPPVSCQENKTGHASSSTQPKPLQRSQKPSFLDAFKEHISQGPQEKTRRSNVMHPKGTRIITGNGTHKGVVSGVLGDPVYDKQGILVGHYVVQNNVYTPPTQQSGCNKTVSPTSDTVTRPRTVSGLDSHLMAAQQLSDCNASNDSDDDLVLELQLDGTRDIKPRDTTNKPAVSTSNDTSTSTMANGHDNDIPLHDKIARKIKAESLARSIPSHEGPFKCPKCKRLYRTKESCGKHALLCDFEVSTSEEEEDEEEEEELSSIEALSARTQAQCDTGTQRCDVIGVTESESVDSTDSSDVISESEPFIGDSEVTPARSRSAADTVTGSCKSYPLRSSRMSSPETTPRDSKISTPASSVRHRRGQSSKDADDIKNGDGAGSGDGESVRTLRSGRRTLTPNDVAPKQCETVTRAIAVSQTPSQCDTITKDSVSQTPQIKPKRGRGRPPKIRGPGRPPKARVENTTEAMSGVNTGSRVKSQVECTPTQLGENKGKEKVDRVKVASEGCDMARMLSCRVDVCQLSVKPPMIDTCKDDVKKCLAVSVREKCQLLSDDTLIAVVSDDTPKLVTNMNSAAHAGMPAVVATSENAPGETAMDISAEFPSASLVSMTIASGVDQCNADTKCTSPAPDMHASSDSASSPVDIPTGSQQQQQHPLQQQQEQQQQQQHGDRVQDKDVETIDSKLSGQLIDITMSSDNVDMTSPAECLMGKDSDTRIAETSVKVSSMQGDVSIVDASLSSVDVSPLCQLPVSDPSYTSVALDDSCYANIPVTVLEMCHSDSSADACDARVSPSDVKESATELPCTKVSVSDLCHTKMAPSDSCDSRVPVGDTVMSTNQSYLAKVTNPCDAGGGLCQTEIPLSNACRTTEASQSLQMLHKGQSPKSMSKVGLLQPVQCHKPILPSSLRHLEVSGQINYLGSFSIDPNSPQVMLRGTTLPCGPHPLIMEHATAAVQGSGTNSNPTQIASMCSTSGAITLGTTWNTDVVGQGEYIAGLQDRTMMCVSNLPRHAVSVRQEELASGAMPDASLTTPSDCLASVGTTHDGRMTVICSASTVCGTLKSFVQSNVCHSLAATRDMPPLTVTNAGRTIQSIEMSSLGVPSVHYQQGMLISHCQPPSQLPSHLPSQLSSQVSSQPFSQMTSAPLRPLMAKHKTSNSVVKKRPIQGPVDHIGLYKKAKLHPMAPPVLQSKQDNVGGRSKLGWSQGEAQKWKYQRRNCGTNKLKTVGRLKAAPGQRRHKPVLGSAVSKTNQGHIMSEGSHPLIHASYQQSSLPEAEVEEEVVESKAVLTSDGYEVNEPLQRDRAKRDSPYLMFEITSDDGFSVQTETCEDAWRAVTERVQDARANARMKQLSYSGVSGLQMFGLTHAVIVQLLEQLQGAKYCRNYQFEYFTHDHRDTDEEPEENPSGVARAEPFIGRKANEMFSFLLSQYRIKPEFDASLATKEEEMVHKSQRRATSMDLPMAMRFRHLRQNAKQACDVYRSDIHGRGLFCKRDIDAGEMIIEYAGEVIRSAMTDRREHYYESKGIGCYMFRIDDMEVVDATMKGSAARFINHSCDPSCYSKVINVDGKKHIIIFAMRPIKRGEELTYDYKFPIEDVKIPCTCGTKRCRRYLN